MRKALCIILVSLSSLTMLLPQSWCCWLVPVDCCQQKTVVTDNKPEQCCCCKHNNDSKPEPAKKSPCPKHGSCANSLRDWAKPLTPSWDDGSGSLAYLLPLGLVLTSDSANLLQQISCDRILFPPLHVQQCVWRC
jgi:hypothetical protein